MRAHGADARAFVACAASRGSSSSVFMGACRRRFASLRGRACPPASCGRGVRRSNDGDDWGAGLAGSMCACPSLLSCHALSVLCCLRTVQHPTLSEATTLCAVLWGRHDKRTKKVKRYIGEYSPGRAWPASSLVLLYEASPFVLTLNLCRHLGEDPAAQTGSDALLTGVLGQEIPMDPAWWWRQRPAAQRPVTIDCEMRSQKVI